MKKLILSLIALLLAAPVAAQDFRHRYFHYDQLFTDPDNQFFILANTVDGADSKQIYIGGGGLINAERGAYLALAGNDYGGANAGGGMVFGTGGSTSPTIQFWTRSAADTRSLRLTLPSNSDADDADFLLGSASTTAPVFSIRPQTADGDDDASVIIMAGGGNSYTRGAYISMTGNETVGAGNQGSIYIRAGDDADGNIYFTTATNYTRLTIPYLADADDVDLVLGSVATTAPVFTIRGQTADGDDDGTLRIAAGGGGGDWARGSYINLYGNEKATTGGDMELSSGVSGGNDIRFLTASSIRLQILGLGSFNDNEFIIGNSNQTASVSTIHSEEADGSDDLTLKITAGGSTTMSGTRGAWIEMQGQDVGGADAGGDIGIYSGAGSNAAKPLIRIANQTVDGSDWGTIEFSAGSSTAVTRGAYLQLEGNEAAGVGDINLVTGDGAAAALILTTSSDTGSIRFNADAVSNTKWTIPATASGTTADLKFGVNAAAAVVASILSNRDTDGTDNDLLQLCGGGACGAARGANIYLYGNEAGSTGSVILESGNGANSIIRIISNGQIQLRDYSGYNSSVNATGVDCEAITIAVGSGAAGVTSATNLCASGTILGLGARVTDAPGGGATTFDVGCTGSGNLDQFCDGVSSALNTTCAYPTNGDGTNTPWVQKTATTMTVTTDANVTGDNMIVRVCPYYFDTTAPTS